MKGRLETRLGRLEVLAGPPSDHVPLRPGTAEERELLDRLEREHTEPGGTIRWDSVSEPDLRMLARMRGDQLEEDLGTFPGELTEVEEARARELIASSRAAFQLTEPESR